MKRGTKFKEKMSQVGNIFCRKSIWCQRWPLGKVENDDQPSRRANNVIELDSGLLLDEIKPASSHHLVVSKSRIKYSKLLNRSSALVITISTLTKTLITFLLLCSGQPRVYSPPTTGLISSARAQQNEGLRATVERPNLYIKLIDSNLNANQSEQQKQQVMERINERTARDLQPQAKNLKHVNHPRLRKLLTKSKLILSSFVPQRSTSGGQNGANHHSHHHEHHLFGDEAQEIVPIILPSQLISGKTLMLHGPSTAAAQGLVDTSRLDLLNTPYGLDVLKSILELPNLSGGQFDDEDEKEFASGDSSQQQQISEAGNYPAMVGDDSQPQDGAMLNQQQDQQQEVQQQQQQQANESFNASYPNQGTTSEPFLTTSSSTMSTSSIVGWQQSTANQQQQVLSPTEPWIPTEYTPISPKSYHMQDESNKNQEQQQQQSKDTRHNTNGGFRLWIPNDEQGGRKASDLMHEKRAVTVQSGPQTAPQFAVGKPPQQTAGDNQVRLAQHQQPFVPTALETIAQLRLNNNNFGNIGNNNDNITHNYHRYQATSTPVAALAATAGESASTRQQQQASDNKSQLEGSTNFERQPVDQVPRLKHLVQSPLITTSLPTKPISLPELNSSSGNGERGSSGRNITGFRREATTSASNGRQQQLHWLASGQPLESQPKSHNFHHNHPLDRQQQFHLAQVDSSQLAPISPLKVLSQSGSEEVRDGGGQRRQQQQQQQQEGLIMEPLISSMSALSSADELQRKEAAAAIHYQQQLGKQFVSESASQQQQQQLISADELSETLRRLRETKARIQQLQAELNATDLRLLLMAAADANNRTIMVHNADVAGKNEGADGSLSAVDSAQILPDSGGVSGSAGNTKPGDAGGGNSSGNWQSANRFHSWPESLIGGLGGVGINGALFAAPRDPPLLPARVRQSMNMPLGLYHNGPIAAPARLIAATFGRAAKQAVATQVAGDSNSSRSNNNQFANQDLWPPVGRAQQGGLSPLPGHLELRPTNVVAFSPTSPARRPTSAPILLASSMTVADPTNGGGPISAADQQPVLSNGGELLAETEAPLSTPQTTTTIDRMAGKHLNKEASVDSSSGGGKRTGIGASSSEISAESKPDASSSSFKSPIQISAKSPMKATTMATAKPQAEMAGNNGQARSKRPNTNTMARANQTTGAADRMVSETVSMTTVAGSRLPAAASQSSNASTFDNSNNQKQHWPAIGQQQLSSPFATSSSSSSSSSSSTLQPASYANRAATMPTATAATLSTIHQRHHRFNQQQAAGDGSDRTTRKPSNKLEAADDELLPSTLPTDPRLTSERPAQSNDNSDHRQQVHRIEAGGRQQQQQPANLTISQLSGRGGDSQEASTAPTTTSLATTNSSSPRDNKALATTPSSFADSFDLETVNLINSLAKANESSATISTGGASGKDSDRRDSSAAGSVTFIGQLFGNLFGGFSSRRPPLAKANLTTVELKSAATANAAATATPKIANIGSATPAAAGAKLTTERVLYFLIATTCSMALIFVIIVITTTTRCRPKRSNGSRSITASSATLIGAQNQASTSQGGRGGSSCFPQIGSHESPLGMLTWRRFALNFTDGRNHQQHANKLIFDGTMRNVSLLARHEIISSKEAAIATQRPSASLCRQHQSKRLPLNIPLPPSMFGVGAGSKSCCQCSICSAATNANASESALAATGSNVQGARGRLPFGTASSLNKFHSNNQGDHSDPSCSQQQQPQQTVLQSADRLPIESRTSCELTQAGRVPVGGTRLRMMSIIDERASLSPNIIHRNKPPEEAASGEVDSEAHSEDEGNLCCSCNHIDDGHHRHHHHQQQQVAVAGGGNEQQQALSCHKGRSFVCDQHSPDQEIYPEDDWNERRGCDCGRDHHQARNHHHREACSTPPKPTLTDNQDDGNNLHFSIGGACQIEQKQQQHSLVATHRESSLSAAGRANCSGGGELAGIIRAKLVGTAGTGNTDHGLVTKAATSAKTSSRVNYESSNANGFDQQQQQAQLRAKCQADDVEGVHRASCRCPKTSPTL